LNVNNNNNYSTTNASTTVALPRDASRMPEACGSDVNLERGPGWTFGRKQSWSFLTLNFMHGLESALEFN